MDTPNTSEQSEDPAWEPDWRVRVEKSSQYPDPVDRQDSLDYEFERLVRKFEADLIQTIHTMHEDDPKRERELMRQIIRNLHTRIIEIAGDHRPVRASVRRISFLTVLAMSPPVEV